MTSEAIIVRFLINSKTGRIAYAEARKDFFDLLYSFLTLPTASILKLLSAAESAMVLGSVNNLYHSVEKLPAQFMSTDKSRLLDPKFLTSYSHNILRIEGGNYYVCSSDSDRSFHNFSYSSGGRCACGEPINTLVQLRQNNNDKKANGSSSQTAVKGNSGFVTEMLPFIITDDLQISNSTIDIINLLNQLKIKNFRDLEERTAIVDRNKALELLKASLVSTTVLNDVFSFN